MPLRRRGLRWEYGAELAVSEQLLDPAPASGPGHLGASPRTLTRGSAPAQVNSAARGRAGNGADTYNVHTTRPPEHLYTAGDGCDSARACLRTNSFKRRSVPPAVSRSRRPVRSRSRATRTVKSLAAHRDPEEDDHGSVEADHIAIFDHTKPIPEPGSSNGSELVDHKPGGLTEPVGRRRRDVQPEQGGGGGVSGERANGNRVSIEAVVLVDRRRPGTCRCSRHRRRRSRSRLASIVRPERDGVHEVLVLVSVLAVRNCSGLAMDLVGEAWGAVVGHPYLDWAQPLL